MGAPRFDVWGTIRAVYLRKYRGRLSFLPANPRQRSGRRWSADRATPLPSPIGTAKESVGSPPSTPASVFASDLNGEAAPTRRDSAVEDGTYASVPAGPPKLHHLLPFDSPVPLQWRTLEGIFTCVWVTNTTHQSIGINGAPDTAHDDGVMTITVIRDVSPCSMVSILLSMDDKGTYHTAQHVETYTCIAFRLEPDMGPQRPNYGAS
jgi:hypothetical protein